MNTLRSYAIGVLALLVLVGALSIAYYKGAIGASTSQAASLSTGAVSQATPPVQSPNSGPHTPMIMPNADSDVNSGTTPQTGAPAIVPTIKNAAANTAAFTEADVRQFAAARNKGFGMIEMASGVSSVDSVQFVTVSQLHAQTSEANDLKVSNNALVCYVVYSGDFAVPDPGGPAGPTSIGYKHIMQVYDAHSGNLLMQSAYDRK